MAAGQRSSPVIIGSWPNKSMDCQTPCPVPSDSLGQISIFKYLIIVWANIYVSERKKKQYKTRQVSDVWLIKSCRASKLSCPPLFYLLKVFSVVREFYLWLNTMIDSRRIISLHHEYSIYHFFAKRYEKQRRVKLLTSSFTAKLTWIQSFFSHESITV